MKKITIFILSIVFLCSCGHKCADTPDLTADELSWLPYSNGQIIIFKNDTGAIDTGFVKTYFDLGKSITDGNGCNHWAQSGTNELSNFTSIPNGDFIISVSHYDQWFPGNLNSANFGIGIYFSDLTPQNNVILNGKSYNNVYIRPDGVYFIKNYGIIAFTTYGVTKWVRIN
jgi:hypothetical protein